MNRQPDPAPLLRDPWLWLPALALGLTGAAVGLWFGPSIGETAAVGAVALGLMGLVPGLVLGLGVALARRRERLRVSEAAAAAAARERFVGVLNSKTAGEPQHALDPQDPAALVVSWTRPGVPELNPEHVAALRTAIESGGVDFEAARAECRANGFTKWVFRINGTTILERAV